MNDTKRKVRAMIQEESDAKRKEELQNVRSKNRKKKFSESTPIDVHKKTLFSRLSVIIFLFFSALALFYGASMSKSDADKRYHLQIETKARHDLGALLKQANHTMSTMINHFNHLLQDEESIKNLAGVSQQEHLLEDLQMRLGKDALVKIINADFKDVDIIRDPNMGYGILFMLKELNASTKDQLQRNINIEAHGLKGDNTRLVFIKKITYFDTYLQKKIVLAYLMAKIGKSFIEELSSDFNTQTGYLEVIQDFSDDSVLMLKKGNSILRPMPLFVSERLSNTHWNFKFWPIEQMNTPPLSFLWSTIVSLSVGLIILFSSLSLLFSVIRDYRNKSYVVMPETAPKSVVKRDKKKTIKHVLSHEEIDDILRSDEVTDVIYGKDHGVVVDTTVADVVSDNQYANDSILNNEDLNLSIEKIFRVSSICGVVGDGVDALVFKAIVYGIAQEMAKLKQTKIAIAYDGRNSSPMLFKAICDAALESDLNVFDIGMATTPMLYFAALNKAKGNGIMVTGGHNPKSYNGLKIMINGQIYRKEQLQILHKTVMSSKSPHSKGHLSELDIWPEYMAKINSNVILARPLKIVVDSGNGVTGKFAKLFFDKLGCKVSVLNDEVEGNFPVHDPDPRRPENMADLIEQVKEERADLGIAFGGDGVRISLVSSAGEIIWPDRILMLLAKDILSRYKDACFLYDVTSSKNVEKFIKSLGGHASICSSESSSKNNLNAEAKEVLAGEFNGHIFIRERWFGFEDAFFVAAKVLEIIAIDLRNSRLVFAEIPDSFNTPEILIATDDAKAIMDKLNSNISLFKQAEIIAIDGIRAEYKDGWGIVKISNTAENLTLRFEADDKQALQRIELIFKEALLTADKKLELPF